MPLPIRDGNQSLTTLSTILVSNSHIPAHTVVSFGAQGITDIATAVSGVELGPNTLNALENITVTLGQVTITGGLTDAQLRASAVTIGGSVTATISGTPSVTFGTAVITGSTSVLNFPATQPVSIASVTIGNSVTIGSLPNISGTVTVSNLPATQAVTFGQPTITGSVSILNIPATQTVTFSQASVTFGTAVITGSTSILNFPATQTVTFGTINGTVTIGNSVTIGSLPAISGTVTANVLGVSNIPLQVAYSDEAFADGRRLAVSIVNGVGEEYTTPLPISGTISGTVTANLGSALPTGTNRIGVVTIGAGTVTIGAGTAQIGSVTASISNSVTIASLPAISGTVTVGNSTTASAVAVRLIAEDTNPGGTGAGVNVNLYSNDNALLVDALKNGNSVLGYDGLSSYVQVKQAVGSSVTISSLPAISGTVTVGNTVSVTGGLTDTQLRASAFSVYTIQPPSSLARLQVDISDASGNAGYGTTGDALKISGSVTIGAGTAQIGSVTVGGFSGNAVTTGYTPFGNAVSSVPVIVMANSFGRIGTVVIGEGTAQIGSVTASISGTVPVSISSVTVGNSVTIGSLPAISGTVTASVSNFSSIASDGGGNAPLFGIQLGFSAGEEDYRLVAPSNPLPVTANSSNGSLTTRFGSVTTANTAFETSAVTNANRKYLLIQNVTTASNVITVGIGFTPTTTQGIQLFAGAGLTFEGSYIPTGAVNLLSSVTASCFTILEA